MISLIINKDKIFRPITIEIFIGVIVFCCIILIILPEYRIVKQRLICQEAVSDIDYIRASADRFWYKNRFIPKDINNLDIENPNNRERLYFYSLINNESDSKIRKYTIFADHKSGKIAWIQENNNIGHLHIIPRTR